MTNVINFTFDQKLRYIASLVYHTERNRKINVRTRTNQ